MKTFYIVIYIVSELLSSPNTHYIHVSMYVPSLHHISELIYHPCTNIWCLILTPSQLPFFIIFCLLTYHSSLLLPFFIPLISCWLTVPVAFVDNPDWSCMEISFCSVTWVLCQVPFPGTNLWSIRLTIALFKKLSFGSAKFRSWKLLRARFGKHLIFNSHAVGYYNFTSSWTIRV